MVDIVGRILTTSWFIARGFLSCGVLLLLLLEFLGISQRCVIYWWGGGTVWGSMLQIFDIWYPCVLCRLFGECNNRIFEDQEHSMDQIIALFTKTLFDWSRAWWFTSSDSILLFLDSLLFVHSFFFSYVFCIYFFVTKCFLTYKKKF